MTPWLDVPPQRTILFIANYPPSTGYAWAWIYGLYERLCTALRAQGIRGVVIGPEFFERPHWYIRHYHATDLYFSDRPIVSRLYRQVRALGVDRIIVHQHTAGGDSIATGLKWLYKRSRFAWPFDLNAADHVIAISEFVKGRLMEVACVPEDRVSVVYNGLPIPDHRPDQDHVLHDLLAVSRDRPIIGYVGRISFEKGFQVALDAFAQLCKNEWSVHRPAFVCIGDGPELASYRSFYDEHPDIYFLGKRDDVARLRPSMTLAVVPSIGPEAFSLAALEAMLAGTPVIASDIGALPELIAHQASGMRVPPKQTGPLMATMKALLDFPDSRTRMAHEAYTIACTYFSADRQLSKIMTLLGAAIAGRDSGTATRQ